MIDIIKSYRITLSPAELEILLLGLDELKGTGFKSPIMVAMKADLESNI